MRSFSSAGEGRLGTGLAWLGLLLLIVAYWDHCRAADFDRNCAAGAPDTVQFALWVQSPVDRAPCLDGK